MGDLHIGRKIGCGTFAKVYKGTWNDRTVALKSIALPPGCNVSQMHAPKEVEILKLVAMHKMY